MKRGTRALAAAALMLAMAASAQAHTRSLSFSRWQFDEAGATVEFRIPVVDLLRIEGRGDAPSYFAGRLQLVENGEAWIHNKPVRAAHAPEGWAVYRWRVRPAAPPTGEARRTIRSRLMEGLAEDHAHFARIESPGEPSRRSLERVLTAERREWALEAVGGPGTGGPIAQYLRLGVEHILGGWDHLAFVVALMLMAATLRELAVIITSFTVAHSVTLGLTVLGVVRPDTAAVEIFIGFSIALVAAENLWLAGGRERGTPSLWAGVMAAAAAVSWRWPGALSLTAWIGLALFSTCHFGLMRGAARAGHWRALVSFLFGLVHGFGFAGVLMEVEMPRERLLPGLLGFNLGVEAGQLAVVALMWPALLLMGRMGGGAPGRIVAVGGSAVLVAFGIFWMTTRNWG